MKLSAKINIYLRFGRIHTACLTFAGILLALYLAGVTNLVWYFLFAAWGILFHFSGFGWNNIFDLPWDRKDLHKLHFPLVTQEIKLSTAIKVTAAMTFFALGFGFLLCNFRVLAIAALVSAVTFGFAYNFGNKIYPRIAPFLITASFASLPLFAYFSFTYDYSFSILLVVKFSIVLLLYQIAVSGNVKDFLVPQGNVLIDLGARVKDGQLKWSFWSKAFAWKLHILKGIIILLGIWYFGQTRIIAVAFYGLATIYVNKMTSDQEYDNRRMVLWASLIEVTSYFALVSIIFLPTDILWWVFTLAPAGWFMFFNRITWGTTVSPKV